MDNLDDFLKGEEEPEVVETPEPVVAEEPAKPEPVRDERGRFVPKGETTPQEAPAEPSATPAPEENKIPVSALQEERRKRQELEQRLADMEQRLHPQAEPQQAPSIWDDEQGFIQHFGGQVVSTAVQQASLNATLNMSEMLARQANPDFDEMKTEFLTLAQENPALIAQARSDPHPWNKAYQIAKNHRTMQELGAVDVASLEAKLREKLMAELATQQPAPTPEVPASLADAQSARASTVAPSPPTLDDILKRK